MNTNEIPKIHRTKTRLLVENIARAISRMNGFDAGSRAFDWLQIEPYLRENINPRSVFYARQTIEILKIVKEYDNN